MSERILDLTKYDGHTGGEWGYGGGYMPSSKNPEKAFTDIILGDETAWASIECRKTEIRATSNLIADSPAILAKLREAVDLLREHNQYLNLCSLSAKTDDFLATIKTEEASYE